MKERSSDELFIDVKNGSDWWVTIGLAEFRSMTGTGPFEDGQSLWIAPGRDASQRIAIPDDLRPVPLLVATSAGLFKIHHRPEDSGPRVEIFMEAAGEEAVVISNASSSLGLWHLIIEADGLPRAEHELV